ncbi:hypothetical protein AYO39_03460 [Actinobacteria bacterium SCGC AG-212-D09]|nr:hypothetical protein AYO39_03460 [Actinobacteria bacterium SCGC AG-212-D09]
MGKPQHDRRTQFFLKAREFTPIMTASSADLSFFISTEDGAVGQVLFVKGSRSEFRVLKRTVAILHKAGLADALADRVFLDVGANIGTSCLSALRLHGFGSAIACEPEPRNYRLLGLNAVFQGVEHRLRALPVAVSDTNGHVDLVVNANKSGSHHLPTGDGPVQAGKSYISVEAVTLDSLVERGVMDPAKVALLWADVQGAEGRMIAGASSLVAEGVPILFELHPGMIGRVGGFDRLLDSISSSYSHYVDLRQSHDKGAVPLRDVSTFKGFAKSLANARRFSDVMVMRLERDTARKLMSASGERRSQPTSALPRRRPVGRRSQSLDSPRALDEAAGRGPLASPGAPGSAR